MVKLKIMDDAANCQGQHTSASKSDKSVDTNSLEHHTSVEKCANSMQSKLGCINFKEAETCSISLVPEQLRKWKVEAYMPQVVSIGPLHKGTRTDLLYMDEIKWRCLNCLLHRNEQVDTLQPKEQVDTLHPKEQVDMVKLKNCILGMLCLDSIVRASYNVDDVKFNSDDLAKIMVLDGCFLLELLISGSPQLNNQLKCQSDGPGTEVIKREEVLSDLTLLENQIPLLVLSVLSVKLFPNVFKRDISVGMIQKHALSILGYSFPDDSKFRAFHFLDLVHQNLKKSIGNGEAADTSHGKQKLQRCATRLEAAGVTIARTKAAASIKAGATTGPSELPEAQSEAANMEAGVSVKPTKSNRAAETRFDLKVTFSEKDGKLEIPQLHVTETTEAKWRNFIAWELNRTTPLKQRGKRTNKSGDEARISCQFICYAWFIQDLICSVHDVQLLRDRDVIVVHELMSNEDLLNLFRNITEGVPEAEIEMDSWFAKVIKDLNSYPTNADRSTATSCKIMVTGTSKIMWHIFRCFLTWIWYRCRAAYRVLRTVYIPSGWKLVAVLAAAAGLGLTITQTVFSALGR